MSNDTATTASTAPQNVPLSISLAPFPEGFQGDCDEYGQQLVQQMKAYITGNWITGMVLPPGSTLPTNDQGPIFMGGVWYWFNPATGTYQPQVAGVKAAKNYAKNCIYQVQQAGTSFANLAAATTKTYDMAEARMTQANVLSLSTIAGPPAGPFNDYINTAANYVVGTTLVANPVATDLFAHEHLIEGSDLLPLQGIVLSLSFWAIANTAGTYSVYITNSGRDHSYVVNFTISTANTWTYVSVPSIPAMPTTSGGTWNFGEGQTGLYIGIPMAVGTQWQTANLGSWQPAFYAGSSKNINLLAVTNNNLAVTGIKLEAGVQCTYLTVPSFEFDLHDAIRYFYTNFSYQSLTAGISGLNLIAQSAGNAAGSLLFPRRMAKVPTVTLYSPSTFVVNTIRNLTTGVDVTAFGAPVATQKGINFNTTITTPASAKADVLAAIVTADARLS
jgi:hypothetical protein